jgi:hypothetical protein
MMETLIHAGFQLAPLGVIAVLWRTVELVRGKLWARIRAAGSAATTACGALGIVLLAVNLVWGGYLLQHLAADFLAKGNAFSETAGGAMVATAAAFAACVLAMEILLLPAGIAALQRRAKRGENALG